MKTEKFIRNALFAMLVLSNLGLCAGEYKFVLREPLGKTWTSELVRFPFTAAAGACQVDAVTLLGPHGKMPVQLTQVEYWPQTSFVKTARITFITDLAPGAQDNYELRFGVASAAEAKPAADLGVIPVADAVTLRTSQFSITLLHGRKSYPEGMESMHVPGPVAGMQLADGTQFGGSAMFGEQKITGYDARITENGPVLAEVTVRYDYADETSLRLTARLAAGEPQAVWSMDSDADLARDGWRLFLTPGLEPLHFTAIPEFYENRWGKFEMIGGKWVGTNEEVDLTREPPGFLVNLVPWAGWWDSQNKRSFTFHLPDRGDVLFIGSRDAGEWIMPAPDGDLASRPYGNEAMRGRWVPLSRGDEGSLYFDFNATRGRRHWQFGAVMMSPSEPGFGGMSWPAERFQRLHSLLHDYVLDWPQDPQHTHPRMYLNQDQLAEVRERVTVDANLVERLKSRWSRILPYPHGSDADALGLYLLDGSPEMAERTLVVQRLRQHLDLFGAFDLMRSPLIVAALYDALIDSDLIAADERPVLRARMAWLAYRMASPATWSAPRGYCSGNPNMTVAYVLQQGQMASLLPDHPMASTWARPALALMDEWLHEVGPEGEHVESVANYAQVTSSTMLSFAIAARNAGLHDYVEDPRMKKLMLFLAKQYTPPDPRGGGNRLPGFSRLPAAGRGPAGQRWDLPAIMARATVDSDPAYARALQWVWLQAGRPGNTDGRLGGFEYVYVDSELPAENPGWDSDFFPAYGAILRSGWGTPDVHYINFQAHIGDGYPTADGSFPAIFAKGAMISTVFNEGYIDREELLVSKVLPARNRGTTEQRNASFYHQQDDVIKAFASLPRQDYIAFDAVIKAPVPQKRVDGPAHAKVKVPEAWPPVPASAENAPIPWLRQLLFMKDEDGAGVNYMILRDTVSGGQPTMWQFWTLSEKIGTPKEISDLDSFLTNRPGNSPEEPRELFGDRFTAIGQFGIDLDYYVASPPDTPRHTLRAGVDYAFYDFVNTGDYQDLLHLQMPDDGVYYVALFPRRRNEAAPEFATFGDGAIIQVRGQFGVDYVFLNRDEIEAGMDEVHFSGTAASIQDRRGGRILMLAGKGKVQYQSYGMAAAFPVSLHIGGNELTVNFLEQQPDFERPINPLNKFGWSGRRFFPLTQFPGGTVTLTAPGTLALAEARPDVKLEKTGADWILHVPAGVRMVRLIQR